ncbi:hypothetical protein TNCV_264531 [Trichonephila clavipes]|nr:hypothetical protein TNCV_264531 [Trichonephila clavipes]
MAEIQLLSQHPLPILELIPTDSHGMVSHSKELDSDRTEQQTSDFFFFSDKSRFYFVHKKYALSLPRGTFERFFSRMWDPSLQASQKPFLDRTMLAHRVLQGNLHHISLACLIPDMSPIEKIHSHLRQQIEQPTNVVELDERLQKLWN